MAGKRRFFIDKEVLDSMYQQMSMAAIAKHLGVGETLIHKRLHEFGIKLRGNEENPRCRPKPFSPEHLASIRRSNGERRDGMWTGEKNPNWRGGLTDLNLAARRSGAYAEWKRLALELAGNKCQQCGAEKNHICSCCGQRVVLHVHHVKSFAKFPDERFDPTNSEVLCAKCHHSRHFGKIG